VSRERRSLTRLKEKSTDRAQNTARPEELELKSAIGLLRGLPKKKRYMLNINAQKPLKELGATGGGENPFMAKN